MELRIGVVHTPKELNLELDGTADEIVGTIDKALADGTPVVWLTDTKGRRVGIPAERIAYIEIDEDGATEARRVRALADARADVMGAAPGLLDRRLLFFTGKGGVGKSTVTAATALLAAEQGKRVLLVEVDAKNNLTALFEHAPVGFEPRQVHPGVFAMQMDTEASLREYLKVQAKVPVFGRIGPMARAFDFVATAAPGVKEILTVGKVCWELRESLEGRADWDLIVVDAAATGHVISQLDAPEAIQELVPVGPDPQPDRLDDRAALRPGAHRAQRGHVAGGDAGERDHRAGRPRRARSSTCRSAS